MSKSLQKVVTAFVINNDPEEVSRSLGKMREWAEKSKDDIPPKQWGAVNCDIEQVEFLIKALSVVSQKILNRFNVKMEGKSREERKKEIKSVNRALYE